MICTTCKNRNRNYCKYFKVKITTFDKNKNFCIAYSLLRMKKTKSTIKKDSIRQEKRLAKKLKNTKLRPASGALPNAKGDMTKGKHYLIDSKSTKKDRITVKKEWLDRVRGQAIKEGRFGVIALDFLDHQYFILSKEDFEEITNDR